MMDSWRRRRSDKARSPNRKPPLGTHATQSSSGTLRNSRNIKQLKAQLENLQFTRQGLQMGADHERRKGRDIRPNVETWLKRANEVTIEVEGIIQEEPKVKKGCLNGWCSNLKLRYLVSRQVAQKTRVVVELQAAGVQFTELSYNPPACTGTIPTSNFMGFESRIPKMEEIIQALTDEKINLIGVCGSTGVGKTKMVKEVGKIVKEEKLFDEVGFVTVGQYPDLKRVQNSVAHVFGLVDLKEHDDAATRASMLRKRLSQKDKRILLILDDIWANFNLEDQGIPSKSAHGTFKFLYTSRFKGLWHGVPTKKDIDIGLLSQEEAWQLFRYYVGDLWDDPNLQPIAKRIVNECGYLPRALVFIGNALSEATGGIFKGRISGKFIEDIWEAMLDQLTCPSSTPADERLSSCLERYKRQI